MPVLLPNDPSGLSILLIFPALISLLLAAETRRDRYAPRGTIFSLLMLGVAWWCMTYAMELASTLEVAMLFWQRLQYLAVPALPVLMLLVIRSGTGYGPLSKRILTGLWTIPVLTVLLQATNPGHYLFYSDVTLFLEAERPRLNLMPGPWYLVHALYSYALGVIALAHLLNRLFPRDVKYPRGQILLLFFGVLIPYLVFTVYFAGWFPIPALDPTPFAFSVSGILMVIGVFGYRLFDLVPIARETVFQKMPDACLVVDRRERILDANEEALWLLGWARIPFGRTLAETAAAKPEFRDILQTSRPVTLNLDKGGIERHLQLRPSPILSKGRILTGHILLIHDDTERTRMEQQLRAVNQDKDRFLSVLGHDLRGSLAGIKGIADLLFDEEHPLTPEERGDLTQSLRDSLRNTLDLLENLLSWGRMHQEGLRVNPQPLEIEALFEEAVSSILPAAQKKKIRLNTDTGPTNSLRADEPLTLLVLRNLLSNAVKFTPENGRVDLLCEETLDALVLTVRDSGIGIPASILSMLGDKTATVGRPGTDGEPSTGLGLVLCFEAMEKQGGRLEIESEEGKGSTFKAVFPKP